MRPLPCLLLFMIMAGAAIAQPRKTITKKELLREFPSIFRTDTASYNGKSYAYERYDSVPPSHPLAGMINNYNYMALGYLLTVYSAVDEKKLERYNDKPKKRNALFIRTLQADTLFLKYFYAMAYPALLSKGITLTDYIPAEKPVISPGQLTQCASKFFYPTNVRPDSTVEWKICGGANGYYGHRSPGLMPLAEAFCFQAVITHTGDEEFPHYKQFHEHAWRLHTETKTMPDPKQRLEKIRQEIFAEMGRNENLQTLLMQEYERRKGEVGFEVMKN